MKVWPIIALVLFGVTVIPAIHFGGYGAVILLSKLTGAPLAADLIGRSLVLIGMIVGIACAASLSIVLAGLSSWLGHAMSVRKLEAVSR